MQVPLYELCKKLIVLSNMPAWLALKVKWAESQHDCDLAIASCEQTSGYFSLKCSSYAKVRVFITFYQYSKLILLLLKLHIQDNTAAQCLLPALSETHLFVFFPVWRCLWSLELSRFDINSSTWDIPACGVKLDCVYNMSLSSWRWILINICW